MKSSIKHIYKLIRNFEFEAGESFTDQFESSFIDERTFFYWMVVKGYISKEQIEAYEKAHFTELNNICTGYEDDFSLFPMGECVEDCHFKAMSILAECITEIPTYQEKLIESLTEHDVRLLNYARYDECFEEEFNKVAVLSIEELRLRRD